LTRQPGGKEITEFKCEICYKRGKFEDGAYICIDCKYAVHEKCAYVYFHNIDEM